MVDFRIIQETTLEDFKKEIRKNLDEGFKMIISNVSVYKPIQRVNPIDVISFEKKINTDIELIYYAYMEKEV